MGKLFGTDGVRGVANKELSVKLAYELGYFTTIVLREKLNKKVPLFVIGMDTRISKDMFLGALVSGINSAGGNVLNAGVVPTPAVAVLVRHFKADSGIVISASHNSYEYNGIKFFNHEGYKLDDEAEGKIEDMILSESKVVEEITHGDIGGVSLVEDPDEIYINYLLKKIGLSSLKGLKVVLDLANGATYKVAKKVFERLGADLTVINNTPNGVNINHECGSTHIGGLKEEVLKVGADIGLAYDGDGDRLIAVDNEGVEFDGDKIMYLISCYLKENNKLNKDTLVLTVMSNLGLKKACSEKGINISETGVGDRYVLERMLKEGYSFGGEQSGHLIVLDVNSTGDGGGSSLILCKILKENKVLLSDISKEVTIYPQVLVNARVKNEKKYEYETNEAIISEINKISEKYEGSGRILIRTSGTEPLIRVMIEGEDLKSLEEDANYLAQFIKKELS